MTATLTVDLTAFDRNVASVRARVAPAELMLVVKNDAYGHGLEAIVSRARELGVGWFGAFDVATAARVRACAGEDARIFVWMVFGPGDARRAVDAALDVGVGDVDTLAEVAAAAGRGRPARVHLKVDTGLHRNGVRPEDWTAFAARARALSDDGLIEVVGIWSHIAEASDAEDDRARELFERAVAQASAAGLNPAVRHLAASAASFARPEFRYDMVRVGAFCYGIRPAGGPSDAVLGIEPIGALDAAVIAVGEGTVRLGVGAADGVLSTLGGRVAVRSPGGTVRVHAIDDTETTVEAWAGAAVGDRVRLFGPGAASATDLAEAVDTIGEEIAVRISPPIPRIYQ